MKPNEYIKKYNLDSNKHFNQDEFINELKFDFNIELEKCNGFKSIKGYDQCVRVLRSKWDAINRKTANRLPEKLWKYIYASYIAKMREEFFSEEMGKRREEKERRKQEYEARKRFYSDNFGDGFFKDYFSSFFDLFFKNTVPEYSFNVLGLNSAATENDINKAYRNLSLKHHPDKGGDAKEFICITEAKDNCLKYLKKEI